MRQSDGKSEGPLSGGTPAKAAENHSDQQYCYNQIDDGNLQSTLKEIGLTAEVEARVQMQPIPILIR